MGYLCDKSENLDGCFGSFLLLIDAYYPPLIMVLAVRLEAKLDHFVVLSLLELIQF